MSELVSVDVQSPFDSLRRVRPNASEYWSARDLMPMMGYPAWREFKPAIERAICAAENQAVEVSGNFGVAPKKAGQRGPAQEDYELSRFAAYLVAMNGDPRKPEVAAAQAYFAIKTREAELVQAVIPETFSDALRLAAEMSDRAREAEAAALYANEKVVELEPLAAEYERFLDAEGTLKMGGVANMFGIGRTTLFKHLKEEGVLQPDRRPYQQYADWFRVIPHGYKNSKAEDRMAFTPTLKPDAVDPMRRLLIRRGRLAA
ncbi:phage antirepressor KilAC domain-containing protein [Rhodococcus sp. NPDC060176]|uniref:phage antirepressor KilAC domain-containing protein n=1 Tax=Rhodococcus sp. NPDC060176 TaxID=3347062 RepID=UPI00365FF842